MVPPGSAAVGVVVGVCEQGEIADRAAAVRKHLPHPLRYAASLTRQNRGIYSNPRKRQN